MGKHIIVCMECRCGCITKTQTARAKHLRSKIHKEFLKKLERGLIEDKPTLKIY